MSQKKSYVPDLSMSPSASGESSQDFLHESSCSEPVVSGYRYKVSGFGFGFGINNYEDDPMYKKCQDFVKSYFGEEDWSYYRQRRQQRRSRTRKGRSTSLPGDMPSLTNATLTSDNRYFSDSSDDDAAEKTQEKIYKPSSSYSFYHKPTIQFLSSPPINPNYLYWINTDGYFRENKKIAGHGLVVRDEFGNPVIAKSWSGNSISPLYHQLCGVLEAYRVAEELGIKRLIVVNNHYWTHDVLNTFEYRGHSKCLYHPENPDYDRKRICNLCVRGYFTPKYFSLFWPIVSELVSLATRFVLGYNKTLVEPICRSTNRIADYMAKYVKRSEVPSEVVIQPHDFPEELKNHLYDLAKGFRNNGVPFNIPKSESHLVDFNFAYNGEDGKLIAPRQ